MCRVALALLWKRLPKINDIKTLRSRKTNKKKKSVRSREVNQKWRTRCPWHVVNIYCAFPGFHGHWMTDHCLENTMATHSQANSAAIMFFLVQIAIQRNLTRHLTLPWHAFHSHPPPTLFLFDRLCCFRSKCRVSLFSRGEVGGKGRGCSRNKRHVSKRADKIKLGGADHKAEGIRTE